MKRLIKYADILLIIYSLIIIVCFVAVRIVLYVAPAYSIKSYSTFAPINILYLVIIVINIIAIIFARNKFILIGLTIVTLIFEVMYGHEFTVTLIAVIIWILIKDKKRKKRIRIFSIISLGLTALIAFTYFITCSAVITHFEYEEYVSPDGKYTAVVREEYCFDKKKMTFVLERENPQKRFLLFELVKNENTVVYYYGNTERPKIDWKNNKLLVNDEEYLGYNNIGNLY